MHVTLHQQQPETDALLWQQWFVEPNKPAREALFQYYQVWAANQAKKLFYNGAFPLIDCDDYIQYGYLGLLEAIDNYEDRGGNFKSFAVLRVRGAVLNAVYKFSEASSLYNKRTSVNNEYIESYVKENAEANDDGMSGVILEISLEYFLQQGTTNESDNDKFALFNSEEMSVMHKSVETLKSGLPKLEQTILNMYYQHGLSYQQIAEHMEVTKGRIGQLHKAIMTKLRKQLSW